MASGKRQTVCDPPRGLLRIRGSGPNDRGGASVLTVTPSNPQTKTPNLQLVAQPPGWARIWWLRRARPRLLSEKP